MIPIKIDFKDIRENRQKINNTKVFNSILFDDKDEFFKHVNKNELNRLLQELDVNFDDIWTKCLDDNLFAKLFSRNISICASRQGTNDEKEQLKVCNITTSKCGIFIENLTSTALRLTKDGNIVSKNDMKKYNITKDNCLKSFDGKITGKINGYISAKVAYGTGGHQDNVFEELDNMADCWAKYKNEDDNILVFLIDTDLENKFNCLKTKYENYDNIKFFNHYSFQEFIINNYNDDNI